MNEDGTVLFGMFIKMDGRNRGRPSWTCRDENRIKYITYEYEYFHPLAEKATRKGGDSSDYQGVHCHIHIHRIGPDRTGPAGQKTTNPLSTERGVSSIPSELIARGYAMDKINPPYLKGDH